MAIIVIVNNKGYLGKSRLIKLVEQLQLPRPTCSSSKHWGITTFSSGAAEWGCNNTIVYSKMYDCSSINSDFGCIHHSDYEVNNE